MVRSLHTRRMLLLISLALKFIHFCETAHNFPPFAKVSNIPYYRPFCGTVRPARCTNVSAEHVHLINSKPKFSHAWTCQPKPRQTVNLLLLIIIAGDVESNQGPWIKYPCGICKQAMKTNIAPPSSVTTVTLGYTTHVLDSQILVINPIFQILTSHLSAQSANSQHF